MLEFRATAALHLQQLFKHFVRSEYSFHTSGIPGYIFLLPGNINEAKETNSALGLGLSDNLNKDLGFKQMGNMKGELIL